MSSAARTRASIQALEPRHLLAVTNLGLYTYTPPFGESQSNDVAIDNKGRVIAAGYTTPTDAHTDAVIIRYTSEGEYDPSFANGGARTLDFRNGNDQALALAIQSDNKILLAGETTRIHKRVALLARLNEDGSLDTTFSQDGILTFALDSDLTTARDVALFNDQILITGAAGKDTF